MAWSSGTFTRTNGTYTGAAVWQGDSAAGIDILATRHDTHDKDIADGINDCLHKGGQNAATANISWGNFKITSLGNGTATTDAATYGQTITALSFDASTRVLTGTRAVANVTVTLPLAAASAAGLVALPATSAGAFYRDDGAFASPESGMATSWATVTANGTSVAGVPERVAAASLTRTLPSTIAANDLFAFKAYAGDVIVSTPHTIKYGGVIKCNPGDTLTVAHGETLYLLAGSTSELEIS
jgi:hypothetical protein